MITEPLFCAANKTLPSGQRLYAGQALCYNDNSSEGDTIIGREGVANTTLMLYDIRQRQFGLSHAGHPVYLEWRKPKYETTTSYEPHIIWQPFGGGVRGEYLVVEQDMIMLYEHEWGAVQWAAGHCGSPSEPYGLILTAEGLLMLSTMASMQDPTIDELALWTVHPGGMEERICGTINLPTSGSSCWIGIPSAAGFALGFTLLGAFLMRVYLWCRPRPSKKHSRYIAHPINNARPFCDVETVELTPRID